MMNSVELRGDRLADEFSVAIERVYRGRGVSMDDMVRVSEGLRLAVRSVLAPGERGPVEEALYEAIASFRRFRRIAGDARKRNRLLQFLYKGA